MNASARTLTPLRVILVYALAFGLVSFHEVDRLLAWTVNLSLGWEAGPRVMAVCDQLGRLAETMGQTGLVQTERQWLAKAQDWPVVGAVGSGRPAALPGETDPVAYASNGSDPAAGSGDSGLPGPIQTGAVWAIGDLGRLETASDSSPVSAALVRTAAAGPGSPAPQTVPANGSSPSGSNSAPGAAPPTPGPASAPSSGAVPSPADPPAVPVRTETAAPPASKGPFHPTRVLIAGDSMILEGFGVAFQRRLKQITGLVVAREGRYSSGLTRPDYFDWTPYLTELLNKHKPDLLVVSLGANDPQDIVDENRKRHFVASESWNQLYGQRARNFLKIATDQGVRVVWVGLPIMGVAKYGERVANLNEVARQACAANPSCLWVDTWLTLAGANKEYTTFLKDDQGKTIRIRATDQIHLTEAGGEVMVQHVLAALAPQVQFVPIIDPASAGPAASGTQTPAASPPGPGAPPAAPGAALTPGTPPAATAANPAAPPGPTPAGAPPDPAGMDGKPPAKTAAGSSASSAPQLKPPTPSARAARMERITLVSKARKKETAFYAFIPLDTGEKKRRPALYLLHGAWDNHASWKDHAELWLRRLAEEHGLIIITPDGDPFGWYADSPYDPANQIETYLLNELIPKVEKDLFALPGKRSVAGLSMGGHGAMTLTLGHPGLFSSASSMSGVLDITMHQAKKWELDRVFGPFDKNQELWERHSAVGILTALEKVKAPPLLVTVGRSDPWVLGDNRLFHEKLKSLGVAHDYQEKAGGHDWAFWTSELPEHVAFHAKILSGKARP